MTEKENVRAYKLYMKGLSAKDIGAIMRYCTHTILDGIRKVNPEAIRSTAGFKEPWNERYFENIDTENKAYFLGFLMADGNISERNNSQNAVRLEIHNRDKYILEILKRELGTSNAIGVNKKRNHSRLVIHSDLMVMDLAKYGIVSRKTGIERFPKELLSEEMQRHFLRGFLDGDGWLTIFTQKKKLTPTFAIGFSKNVNILTDIRDYFIEHLNDISRVKIHEFAESEKGYPGFGMLLFNKKQNVLDIAEFLYKDATIYLERKYEVYQEMLKISRGRE